MSMDHPDEAEALAEAMHDEVIKNAWADWEIADALEPGARSLSQAERDMVEAAFEAAYLNTMRMLIRRGLLKAA